MKRINSILLSLLLALTCLTGKVNAEDIVEETVIEETIDEVTVEETVEQDLVVEEETNESAEEVLIVEETIIEETIEEEVLVVEEPQEEIINIEEEIVEEAVEETVEELSEEEIIKETIIEEETVEEEAVSEEAKSEQNDTPADSEDDNTPLTEIYVKPEANNSSEDGSKDNPVTSLDKAIELLNDNHDVNTIYVLGTLELEGEVSLPEGVALKRGEGFTKSVIKVPEGKELTLSNITVDGNGQNVSARGPLVEVAGTFNMNAGTVLQNNNTRSMYGAGVHVSYDATFNMNAGSIINNSNYVKGGGVGVYGTMNMYGGLIDGNVAEDSGGGIILADNGPGTMNMYGGTISHNIAKGKGDPSDSRGQGGGIAVGQTGGNCQLYVYGGTIHANKAYRAGGGIFVQAGAYAHLKAATITDNTAFAGNVDYRGWYAGGGIYVNGGYEELLGIKDGLLEIDKVFIYDNESYEDGGGIANCPTSKMNIYLSNGSLITGNYQRFMFFSAVRDDFYAKAGSAGPNGMVDHTGNPTIFLSSVMLGGARNNWMYRKTDKGYDHLDEYYTLQEGESISLVNEIDEAAIERARANATVIITGNWAKYGKGGGIGSNGIVKIGQEFPKYGSLKVSKTVRSEEDVTDKEFSFKVTLDYEITGTYGDMVFENGVSEFTLKDGESKVAEELIPDISYTVEELSSDGYTVKYIGNTSGAIEEETQSVVEVINTQIVKRDIEGEKTWVSDRENERPESITVRLYANGEEVDSRVVTAEDEWKYKFTDLDKYDDDFKEIEYTISEDEVEKYTTAIDGYDITNTRKPEKVLVSKQDVAGEELVGASLELYDVDNKLITSWISDGKEKEFELLPGTYVLHEKEAPEGFEKVEDITFEVDEDGNVKLVKYDERQVRVEDNKLVIIDYLTPETPDKILISKQNLSGEELVGASLELYDGENKIIASWVSDGKEKEFELLPGTYVLHEKEAPEGYEKVENITFEVDKDGNVKLVKYDERQARVEDNKLVIIDYLTPETPDKILISKQNLSGEELVGASLELYDGENKIIASWVSDGKEKEFELLPGTYVLHEKEAPEGYEKVEDITFEVDEDGNVKLVKYDARQVRVEGNKLVVIDYLVPETPDEPEKPSIPPTPKTPSVPPKKPSVDTSDNSNSLMWFGLMVMSLGAAFITARRLKEYE